MSQEAVERVLGRLITDERFRRLVANSMETACLHEGYPLSVKELRLLAALDLRRFGELADGLDPCLCRALVASDNN